MQRETAFSNQPDPDGGIDIRAMAGRIGAEVRGLSLSDSMPETEVQAILRALYRHKVIFFRGQHHLDDPGQEAFTARLGEVVVHATLPARPGTKAMLDLDSEHGGIANSWHTDLTFLEHIPAASVLRGVVIPEAGGDTLWANTATAYAFLPTPLRLLADQLWALHTNAYDYAAELPDGKAEVKAMRDRIHRSTFVSTAYETEHPLVRVHPVTGERALLLGHFIKRFVGLNPEDSRRLFDTFQEHIVRPENTVRWRWCEGDVAIWDNAATQHRAIADFGQQRRILRRVTITGPAPVAVDGRASRPLVAPATAIATQ